MNVVYKYNLSSVEHLIPEGFTPVHAGVDPNGDVCVWAEVNPAAAPQAVRFFVVATGAPVIEGHWTHVATYIDDPFVWHVYYEIDPDLIQDVAEDMANLAAQVLRGE
jgi:hypothetical protein